jgi:hypothetical protein
VVVVVVVVVCVCVCVCVCVLGIFKIGSGELFPRAAYRM